MYVFAISFSGKHVGGILPSTGYWHIRPEQMLNKNNYLNITTKLYYIKRADEDCQIVKPLERQVAARLGGEEVFGVNNGRQNRKCIISGGLRAILFSKRYNFEAGYNPLIYYFLAYLLYTMLPKVISHHFKNCFLFIASIPLMISVFLSITVNSFGDTLNIYSPYTASLCKLLRSKTCINL